MASSDPTQNRQKILLGAVLVLGLGYLGYTYVYVPKAEAITALESRLSNLETQNQTARVLMEQDGEAEIQRRLVEYNDQLERVEGLIPSSEELPDLLDAISTEAQRTGVELALIQPVEAVAEEFYTRRIYDLAVLGSYHEIGEFLGRVGSLPRIVTPTGLNLTVLEEVTRDGDPKLEARFGIETYVLPATQTAEATL
jgi:type IV pilus assembly protein PilO